MPDEVQIRQSRDLLMCPHCGARVVGEICEYCGGNTGIETANATLIYPEMQVRDYTVTDSRFFIGFAALWEGITTIVTLGFAAFAVCFEDGFMMDLGFMTVFWILFIAFFHLIGLCIGVAGVRLYLRRKAILERGEILTATCYGFTDTDIKWLVEVDGQPKFIFTKRRALHREFQVGWKMNMRRIDNDICLVREE